MLSVPKLDQAMMMGDDGGISFYAWSIEEMTKN
jgi:hypothetical protein